MSLLNDMLRDLSQQQPKVESVPNNYELLQETKLLKVSAATWVPAVIIFILVFFGVFFVSYFAHNSSKKNQEPSTPGINNSVNDESTSNIKAQLKNKTLLSSTEANEKKNLEHSAHDASDIRPDSEAKSSVDSHARLVVQPNAVDQRLQEHIQDLLQQANRALTMDRLTSPIEDNAYTYYKKILTLSAEQPDAKKGLETIAGRYLEKAREQIQFGNQQQADVLIQRARYVDGDYVDIHVQSLTSVNTEIKAEQKNIPSFDQTIAPENMPHNESVSSFNPVEASAISVTPNAAWKDEQLSQQARTLMEQGKTSEAMSMLKNFIASEQKPVLSTLLLADIYFQQNNIEAVKILLLKTDYLPDVEKTRIKAQILSIQGDNNQAIALLEQQLSASEHNESYRALLASLYHKVGNYQQSIIHYQRLLNDYGEKPAYWLGVALAYDGLSQRNNALQAYLRLRDFPQLQPEVRNYLDQRIAILRKE